MKVPRHLSLFVSALKCQDTVLGKTMHGHTSSKACAVKQHVDQWWGIAAVLAIEWPEMQEQYKLIELGEKDTRVVSVKLSEQEGTVSFECQNQI